MDVVERPAFFTMRVFFAAALALTGALIAKARAIEIATVEREYFIGFLIS